MKILHLFHILFLSFATTINSASFAADMEKPELLLAKPYNQHNTNIKDYWVSEKYDGARAYWDGKQFISRQGNIYHAPTWFTANFPLQKLDGELWIGRNQFEATMSTIQKQQPIDSEWKRVRYMVFELPNAEGTFSERLTKIKTLIDESISPYLRQVPQFKLNTTQALQEKLKEIIKQGGEGLMMHRADTLYVTGRSDALLKVKSYQDAEATVIAHLEGKGKYRGMLGSLLVKTTQGIQFKIGSGFSDAQRKNPPAIGHRITYKYYGLTKNGIPKFASFLRTR
ncbi:MAG: DNA ligase (ATP) (EC [uncultured Thiotrichaceae bacterium]|uniref:DNA ligase (ATP) (EC) n=1 Tax=uncultured Thiotrichaceae bacterium TaxID=298394 RepID=A0A6S6TZY8_9GAMM|nr:MAG: DNA ligase (ATP) (EC [uncultured Thiotrichaceae bacterium]